MTDSASHAPIAPDAETSGIGARLAGIRAQISAACLRSNRSTDEVTLVAVSKTVSVERIRSGISAGLRVFGENRVQEAGEKIAALAHYTAAFGTEREIGCETGRETGPETGCEIEWHLIGHLQSNKARRAVELFSTIHSIDGVKLAERIDRVAGELGRRVNVLVEVNLGGESSKAGLAEHEALPAIELIAKLPNLDLKGLMTVPPYLEPAERVRPFFRRLRELRDEAHKCGIADERFQSLSMGMSHDFGIAVEEGATMVRIGTALFGPRP
ncbi:MAG: YggS family pyridoxal phosphate-dependent enzyme [Acidobacteria bacterium]|nr:YggS family pyridoxal phosphate-dependent enzyme [Acidobacteriota bacterium]MCW5971003.1 YggS family pyridoxal phosphate-dependent enzyme [Blastocatellales bacterium]